MQPRRVLSVRHCGGLKKHLSARYMSSSATCMGMQRRRPTPHLPTTEGSLYSRLGHRTNTSPYGLICLAVAVRASQDTSKLGTISRSTAMTSTAAFRATTWSEDHKIGSPVRSVLDEDNRATHKDLCMVARRGRHRVWFHGSSHQIVQD